MAKPEDRSRKFNAAKSAAFQRTATVALDRARLLDEATEQRVSPPMRRRKLSGGRVAIDQTSMP